VTLFAEVSTPSTLTEWLVCLGFVMWMTLMGFKLSKQFKQQPPAGELDARVRIVEGAVGRHEQEIKEVNGAIRQLRDDIVRNGEVRKAAIERKVEDVRLELKDDISGMRAAMQEQMNTLIEKVGELKGRAI
jgi:uncharacterized coiled-coil protein SlyX